MTRRTVDLNHPKKKTLLSPDQAFSELGAAIVLNAIHAARAGEGEEREEAISFLLDDSTAIYFDTLGIEDVDGDWLIDWIMAGCPQLGERRTPARKTETVLGVHYGSLPKDKGLPENAR